MSDVLDKIAKWVQGIEPDTVMVEMSICDFKQIVGEMQRLREALARAEGEREELFDSLKLTGKNHCFSGVVGQHILNVNAIRLQKDRAEAAEQERDTLKAEREKWMGLIADVRDAFPAEGDRVDRCISSGAVGCPASALMWATEEIQLICAQLTQAEEARKLCAVQMMALEKERDEVNNDLLFAQKEIEQVRDQLEAAEQELSTLPRTYKQGAEEMRGRAAVLAEDYDFEYPGRLACGLTLRQWTARAIRALPTKEG